MIENKTYLFKDEFCQELNIPMNQAERRLNELLDWLKIFFDYDFIKGKGTPHIITIKEQYCEYEPLLKKASKVPEMTAFYEQETDHIIQYKPRNSGSNIARQIVYHNNKYNHAEGTIANYIRPYLRAAYYIDDKQWEITKSLCNGDSFFFCRLGTTSANRLTCFSGKLPFRQGLLEL